jgi:hypothetical protein
MIEKHGVSSEHHIKSNHKLLQCTCGWTINFEALPTSTVLIAALERHQKETNNSPHDVTTLSTSRKFLVQCFCGWHTAIYLPIETPLEKLQKHQKKVARPTKTPRSPERL